MDTNVYKSSFMPQLNTEC